MGFESLTFNGFGAGLDLTSDITKIRPDALPYAENFRLSDSGSLDMLLGDGGSYTVGASTGARDLAWYESADGTTRRIIMATDGTGSNGKWTAITLNALAGVTGGTYTDIRTSLTASSNTTFVVHDDLLYGLDPQNNIATWDGTTLTAYAPGVDTGPNKGIILGIWQNRMWTAKATGGVLGMRVEWSDPADATTGFVGATGLWPTDNYVELGSTSGSSEVIVGGEVSPDGLLVFTNRSVYLIYDDTDGSNVAIDTKHGCLGRRTIQKDEQGNILYLSRTGIRRMNGRLPSVSAAKQIDPFFRQQGVSEVMQPCSVIHDGSYWVAFTPNDSDAATSPYNRVMFELSLETGSVMWHTTMAQTRCFLSVPSYDEVSPKLYRIRAGASGGTHDGNTLSAGMVGVDGMNDALVHLPYVPIGDPLAKKRLRRVHVGTDNDNLTMTVYPLTDHEFRSSASGTSFSVSWPDGTDTVEVERGFARITGVSGYALSLLASVSASASGSALQSGVFYSAAFTEATASTLLTALTTAGGLNLGLIATDVITLTGTYGTAATAVSETYTVTGTDTLDDLMQWASAYFPFATFTVNGDGTVSYQSGAGADWNINALSWSAASSGATPRATFNASDSIVSASVYTGTTVSQFDQIPVGAVNAISGPRVYSFTLGYSPTSQVSP